jgi:BirA family transcriptional regulator, biotin operon repressor / biotin---[acetyl-CoA-carboxylase] ligase
MANGTGGENCGFPIVEFDEIDSTNLEALRRANSGEHGPQWIIAAHQTNGRGRSGRPWQSQSGNLAATLLFTPGCTPADLHQLSFLTGVAVHAAISLLLPPSPTLRLKWPNDILAGHAKLCGILIESTMAGGIATAAIGIGVNVAAAPALDGRQAAALADFAVTIAPRRLLTHIDAAMRHWLGVWSQGTGFPLVRTAWLLRSCAIGQPISVNTGTETISGTFAGIDETGALLLGSVPPKPDHIRRFTYGDVSLLPPRDTEGSS